MRLLRSGSRGEAKLNEEGVVGAVLFFGVQRFVFEECGGQDVLPGNQPAAPDRSTSEKAPSPAVSSRRSSADSTRFRAESNTLSLAARARYATALRWSPLSATRQQCRTEFGDDGFMRKPETSYPGHHRLRGECNWIASPSRRITPGSVVEMLPGRYLNHIATYYRWPGRKDCSID